MASDPPVNPPKENLSETAKAYRYKSERFTVSAGNDRIYYIPYKVNFQPSTIVLGATSSITVEGCASPNDILNGDVEGESPMWKSITTASIIKLDQPFTAVRITNGSGSVLTVDIIG